jgi:hypothetical protein
MVLIEPGKMSDTPEGPSCILYSNGRYQEFRGDLDDEDIQTKEHATRIATATETDEEFYDPEMDSPSSWTTKSSREERSLCHHLLTWRNANAAILARVFSNVILASATATGIVYGAMLRFVTHNNKESIGVAVMFGSAVGGTIALILVNLSWSYRRKNDELILPTPCCSSLELTCPIAQVSGSILLLLTGAILVPAYHQNTKAILILICGILLPILILVNLPMLFGGISNADDEEEQTGEKEIDVLPGSTLDCHREPAGTKVRRHKRVAIL